MEDKKGEKMEEKYVLDMPVLNNKDFRRSLRFGTIDSSVLFISLMAGFSLDTYIAKRLVVKG